MRARRKGGFQNIEELVVAHILCHLISPVITHGRAAEVSYDKPPIRVCGGDRVLTNEEAAGLWHAAEKLAKPHWQQTPFGSENDHRPDL
jgi:hypothetical protein